MGKAIVACIHDSPSRALLNVVEVEDIPLAIEDLKTECDTVLAIYVGDAWLKRSDIMTNKEHADWEDYFKLVYRKKHEHSISEIHATE